MTVMQPSETQVQKSLAALQRPDKGVEGAGSCGGSADLPPGLLEGMARKPDVRPERVEAVRARLAEGAEPSAADIAHKLVGRLVCDRLR